MVQRYSQLGNEKGACWTCYLLQHWIFLALETVDSDLMSSPHATSRKWSFGLRSLFFATFVCCFLSLYCRPRSVEIQLRVLHIAESADESGPIAKLEIANAGSNAAWYLAIETGHPGASSETWPNGATLTAPGHFAANYPGEKWARWHSLSQGDSFTIDVPMVENVEIARIGVSFAARRGGKLISFWTEQFHVVNDAKREIQ